MKLSEIKGEKALDMLAEIIEPLSEIAADKEFAESLKAGKMSKAVKQALKNHKESVITILAVLSEKPPAEYECNLLSLPMQLLDIINDPWLKQAFISQSQDILMNSGSATENTEENGI